MPSRCTKYLRYFYRNGTAPNPVSCNPYQFCCRNASSFCHRTADSGISEKDPVCDPSDFPVLCIFRRCLYAPFPVLWKIYGDFFIPQHYCRHVYPHYVLYLSIPVSQYYPHQRAEWSGKIRDLSDTQCSQPMYPGSFCTLCHTDFRNPGISVRDTIQRTYPYSTAYHCALCSW